VKLPRINTLAAALVMLIIGIGIVVAASGGFDPTRAFTPVFADYGAALAAAAPLAAAANKKYLTLNQLCERWGNCTTMSIERKLRDDKTFPQPVRLLDGRMRYFALDEIEAYERKAAARPAPAYKPLKRRAASGARP
jgi:hypothetical protein